jgi:DNA-binding protein H-NS
MKRAELERMDVDDLWALHVEVERELKERIGREQLLLEHKLKRLRASTSRRRWYPPVFPKYRNPVEPSEIWSGRGKQPRWLVAQLRLGRRIEDFRIRPRTDSRIHGAALGRQRAH